MIFIRIIPVSGVHSRAMVPKTQTSQNYISKKKKKKDPVE